MTTMTAMTEWCAALDALRKSDSRLNAAAACPLREFDPGNGFIFATSFFYDAQRIIEGESPISPGRGARSVEELFNEARDWARYGLAYTPPGWENIASVFETLVQAHPTHPTPGPGLPTGPNPPLDLGTS